MRCQCVALLVLLLQTASQAVADGTRRSKLDAADPKVEDVDWRGPAAKIKTGDGPFWLHDEHKRLVYVQPYGGLGNRLRGIASALTESKSRGFDVRIVWQAHEWTAFNAEWSDLFSGPELPMATFPGGSTDPLEAKCQVHDIENPEHYATVASKRSNWKMINNRPTVCLRTLRWLSSHNPNCTHWFYPLVKPSAQVAQLIDDYKMEADWDHITQWVGVHIRRTDLPIAGAKAADVLPISAYKDIVAAILSFPYAWDRRVRLFLATDDAAVEEDFRKSFPPNEHGIDTVYTYTKDWKTAHRDNLAGMLHGLADLMLLSQCKLIIGTYTSSFSEAAVALGNQPFYIMVGEHFERQEAIAPLPKVVIPIAETGGRPGADAPPASATPSDEPGLAEAADKELHAGKHKDQRHAGGQPEARRLGEQLDDYVHSLAHQLKPEGH